MTLTELQDRLSELDANIRFVKHELNVAKDRISDCERHIERLEKGYPDATGQP